MIMYTVTVTILVEVGENHRLKFYVEHLVIILFVALVVPLLSNLTRKLNLTVLEEQQ